MIILTPKMKWISYSQIENLTEIAKGGFGIIYQATWSDGPLIKGYRYGDYYIRKANQTVIVKRFENSQDIGKYFLNEVCIFNSFDIHVS